QGLRLRYDVFSLGVSLVDLHHPSILPTIEVNLDGIPPYVVTAYAPGGSLVQRIQQKGSHPFPLPEAFAIITQVGQALAYLQQQQPRGPQAPRQLNPALSIRAERAILRAVSANPDLRYDSIEAFVAALGTQ